MTNLLDGQIAVVTGGASGIGEACVRELASFGARLVVADIDGDRAQNVAASIPGAMAAMLDVTDMAALDTLASRVEAELGAPSILIASAGVIQRPLPPEELSMATWDRVVAVDQRGLYVSNLAFGRRMAMRGRVAIVNIASITSFRSVPLHAYAPAKAAVVSITECLAAEWGRSGVRVNAVAPGYTLTPALQNAIDSGERDTSILAQNAAMGRLVAPHEVAKACRFLVSDDASAITGITLPVDAGWLVGSPWMTYGGVRAARSP